MVFGWLSGKKDPLEKALEKARKLSSQARWAEALTYFEEARSASPESAEALEGLRACRERLVEWNLDEARAYATAGDLDKAREHGRLAVDLAAEEADLRDRATEALAGLAEPSPSPSEAAPTRLFAPSCACASPCGAGDEPPPEEDEEVETEGLFEFYLESLSAAERDALEHLGPTFEEGFVRLQQGETTRARPLLEQAAAEAPSEPGPAYALGLLSALEKDAEAAVASFAEALERAPHFAPAAHHRADVLRETGKPADGARLLEDWVKGHAEDGEAWLLLGACRLEAGEPAGGLSAAEEAERRAEEGDPRPQLLKGRALTILGRADEALTAYQAVATRRPDLLEALIPLGRLLLGKGGASAERAAEVFKRCYRLDPERGWWYLLRVAEAYAARGWKDEARDMVGAAQRELPESEEARVEWTAVSRSLTG